MNKELFDKWVDWSRDKDRQKWEDHFTAEEARLLGLLARSIMEI